jgi:glycosyltransferase involved in cell wall biosynthesis
MKLFYISNSRIPTERAHGIQIMKMCEAFVNNNIDLTLLIPYRNNIIKENPFFYYEIEEKFKIKKLPSLGFLPTWLPFYFLLTTISFGVSVLIFLLFQKGKFIIYSRGEIVLFLKLLPTKFNFFWETHIKPNNVQKYNGVFKKSKGLITVTKYYKDELFNKFKVSQDKILYFPDAVDFDKFNISISKKDARLKLNLPKNKKLIIYTGSGLGWKGVGALIETVKFLSDDYLLILIGDIKSARNLPKNILFLGHKKYQEIPYWLKAADLLVLTGNKKSKISLFYTSPMKMFEYMASGTPILASNIPSFKDVLNKENSILIDFDNFKIAANKIKEILNNKELANKLANKSLEDVKRYTWNKRAKVIKNFIKNRII